jgi:hypothetical protein
MSHLDFIKESALYEMFAAETKAKSRAEGKAEGEAKGRAEGRAEGKMAGQRQTIFWVLEGRFGRISDSIYDEIQHADEATLKEIAIRVGSNRLSEILAPLDAEDEEEDEEHDEEEGDKPEEPNDPFGEGGILFMIRKSAFEQSYDDVLKGLINIAHFYTKGFISDTYKEEFTEEFVDQFAQEFAMEVTKVFHYFGLEKLRLGTIREVIRLMLEGRFEWPEEDLGKALEMLDKEALFILAYRAATDTYNQLRQHLGLAPRPIY